jgi:hypothetical protein
MKKVILLFLLSLLVLPSVLSTIVVVCNSDQPYDFEISKNDFSESGDFSLILENKTETDIDIISVLSDDTLDIREKPHGLITAGGELVISGYVAPEEYPIHEKILIGFKTPQEEQKVFEIECLGRPPPTMPYLDFVGGVLLTGIILAIAGFILLGLGFAKKN